MTRYIVLIWLEKVGKLCGQKWKGSLLNYLIFTFERFQYVEIDFSAVKKAGKRFYKIKLEKAADGKTTVDAMTVIFRKVDSKQIEY